MTGKLLAYHLKSPRVPLVVRVPQFENHWVRRTGSIDEEEQLLLTTTLKA